jgi:hypothetical protein
VTTETRYFRSDTEAVGGTTYYKLLILNTNSGLTKTSAEADSALGIKVKDYTSGVYISGANCVAVAAKGLADQEDDGTWTCPQTAGVGRVVVEVWKCLSYSPYTPQAKLAEFITEDLAGVTLTSVLWTVHYWGYKWQDEELGWWISFPFGSAARDSRITNFQYTVPAAGLSIPVAMHHYMTARNHISD